jgi:hypothetical protein
MIKSEEINTTQINLRGFNNLSWLQQRLGQMVIEFYITELKIRTVAEPE